MCVHWIEPLFVCTTWFTLHLVLVGPSSFNFPGFVVESKGVRCTQDNKQAHPAPLLCVRSFPQAWLRLSLSQIWGLLQNDALACLILCSSFWSDFNFGRQMFMEHYLETGGHRSQVICTNKSQSSINTRFIFVFIILEVRLGRWFDKVFVTWVWGLEDGSLAPILRLDTVVRHLEPHCWGSGDGKILSLAGHQLQLKRSVPGSLRNLFSETTLKNTRGRYLKPTTCMWTHVCEHLFTLMQYTHRHSDGLSITFSMWEMNTPEGSICPSLLHIYHHLKAWASWKGSRCEFAYVYFNSSCSCLVQGCPLIGYPWSLS